MVSVIHSLIRKIYHRHLHLNVNVNVCDELFLPLLPDKTLASGWKENQLRQGVFINLSVNPGEKSTYRTMNTKTFAY